MELIDSYYDHIEKNELRFKMLKLSYLKKNQFKPNKKKQ